MNTIGLHLNGGHFVCVSMCAIPNVSEFRLGIGNHYMLGIHQDNHAMKLLVT